MGESGRDLGESGRNSPGKLGSGLGELGSALGESGSGSGEFFRIISFASYGNPGRARERIWERTQEKNIFLKSSSEFSHSTFKKIDFKFECLKMKLERNIS